MGISILAQYPVINKNESGLRGTTSINPIPVLATPIALPDILDINNDEGISLVKSDVNILNGTLVSEDSLTLMLNPGEFTYFTVDALNENVISEKKPFELSNESHSAINLAPAWLEDQLRLKLSLIRKYSLQLEKEYAGMILSAQHKYVDEIAFVIANMSIQSLTDSRFLKDKQMIVRNAEFIYKVDDSLSYVNIVEKEGNNPRDYHTTTTYRIYDPVKKDTIWSEIPRDIYYWYLVSPKMDQEGVYVTDNNNDNSGQRTYGYSWRDFIWNNPDPTHDYRNVNITTSKGTVGTIPRFGELIKNAKILWDRNKTYLTFNRPINPTNSALDLIGNWCSRALPVDVSLPRAFQPNQILMKHNGMCNEDAFLVAATCRTALIPIIYLGTWCEDHVFGAVWDLDWNHFEFFRGGLSETGTQFYGITNMLDRGSYGWKNSMVEGFRPDGYPINFTSYYANTCGLSIRVLDKNSIPIDGAMLNFFASPNAYNANYTKCGTAFTNKNGYADLKAGEQKKYLVQAYHPKFGWSPADSTQAFVVTSTNSIPNMIYRVNVAFPNSVMPTLPVTVNNEPGPVNYMLNIELSVQDILTGSNNRDSQNSKFYNWSNSNISSSSVLICDEDNFNKFKNGEPFTSRLHEKSSGDTKFQFSFSIPQKLYVIVPNSTSTVYLQNVKAKCTLQKITSDADDKIVNDESIAYPNPFTETISISESKKFKEIRIYDILGNQIDRIEYPDRKWTPKSISAGNYTLIVDYGLATKIYSAVYLGN
jgi:hypothetical protein